MPRRAGVIVDGARIAYRVDGDAPAPIVAFVNSLGTDLRMWEPQVAPLLGAGFRVLRYDARGHGESGGGGPATLERRGRDLLAVLDHLGVPRAHICGLSLGGITALWVAAHHPERVWRAVFANTAARLGSEASWNARIEAVRAGGMRAIRDAVVSRFLGPDFRAHDPATTRAIGDMVERTPVDGYVDACLALRDADLRRDVGRIRAPSLIIAGERDESTPPAQSEELHEAIAGSELLVLPGAAHLTNVERAGAFTAALLEFLA